MNLGGDSLSEKMTSVPVSGDEWGTLASTFRETMFRLEALAEYDSPDERPLIQAFERGETSVPTGPLAEYFTAQRELVLSGKSVERVHVVPDELTPYLRWQILWAYQHLADAGVKVYLLPESKCRELANRAFEFYLIDDTHLIEVVYGPRGNFLELRRETNIDRITEAQDIRNQMLREAIPFKDFVAQLNQTT